MIKRLSVIIFLAVIVLIGGISFASEKLEGLLKSIDYTDEDLLAINSLSSTDVEWLLFEADVEESFDFSGPRILMLIGKGLQKNSSSFEGETLDKYIERVIEIAEQSKESEFYSSYLKVLEKEFDHPLVTRYLNDNAPDEYPKQVHVAPKLMESVASVPEEKADDIPLSGEDRTMETESPFARSPIWPYVLVGAALVGIVIALLRSRKR